jgi:hypothetical protein
MKKKRNDEHHQQHPQSVPQDRLRVVNGPIRGQGAVRRGGVIENHAEHGGHPEEVEGVVAFPRHGGLLVHNVTVEVE